MKKISEICKLIFGYSVMVAMIGGGLTFFAYVIALVIGGDAAALICEVTYKRFMPVLIKIITYMILFGLVCMYLDGEKALSLSQKKGKTDK